MAVEIRELIIKTTVSDRKPEETGNRADETSARPDLVECCVEEVLKILKREKER
jgi:hypothetical protein